ncbi:tRNA pseudouridine synthase B [Prochlorococcus marinus str. SS2]|nr:tRNA pseudouridine synthase B [Prochlorococcus marinus str. SS2]KGG24609.1 tRNA pseudouridine synthase B [Prochlorococcus marinus str. SS35]
MGFLVINKPAGLTSHDCVNRLRRIYGIKRIGHGGTLDPAVTGVLPIAIGKATRLLSFLPSPKTYEGTIKLGISTNTDDLTGETISEHSWDQVKENSILNCLNKFQGEIKQCPPIFSSVHINGERAYKKARRGEFFELPPKLIKIYRIKLINWNKKDGTIDLEVHCSPGTYIRSLARDIGKKLGCGGALAKLNRTMALGFNIDQAIELPDLDKNNDLNKPMIIDPLKALSHLPSIKLMTIDELSSWRKGKHLILSKSRLKNPLYLIEDDKDIPKTFLTVINNENHLIGLARWHHEPFKIEPKIVFNADG